MRAHVIVTMLAISGAAACATPPTQPLPTTGGPITAEEQYFNENVKSIFQNNCATCHANSSDDWGAPDFLGSSPDTYYNSLVERRDFVSCDVRNSLLLIKGLDPTHPGVTLPPNGQPNVESWLAMEADVRFGGVCSNTPIDDPTPDEPDPTQPPPDPANPPPLTGLKAMELFGDCATYDDYVNTGLYQVGDQQTQPNNVQCRKCHNPVENGVTGELNAAGDNFMPDYNVADGQLYMHQSFTAMRYPYEAFNMITFTVSPDDGSFQDIVQSERWIKKGIEGGTHPTYNLSQNRIDVINNWFQITYNRWHDAMLAGTTCDPKLGDAPAP